MLRPIKSTSGAFTIVETMAALAVIAFAVSGVAVALLQLNRFAVSERNRSNAKELCQERIEQVVTADYTATSLPAVLAAGQAPENVTIYLDKDNITARVRGTRTTEVNPIATADASLRLLRVTVTVAYQERGRKASFQMSTMRAPD